MNHHCIMIGARYGKDDYNDYYNDKDDYDDESD